MMNKIKFIKVIDDTILNIRHLVSTKGEEYTISSDDQLANFRGEAKLLDISPFLVWAIYFNKHFRAVQTFIKDRIHGHSRVLSEPITGRIDDMIMYLLLLKALVKDTDELTHCHADSNGDCDWDQCPQTLDKEPRSTGRSCPLWVTGDIEL